MNNECEEEGARSIPLPRRCIFDEIDMKSFMESSTKSELLNFVEAMGKACASTTEVNYSYDPTQSLVNLPPAVACLHGALQEMVRWVDDFPPESATGSAISIRFGNPAFRAWHKRLVERSDAIITTILLSRDDDGLTAELACQRGRDAASGVLRPNGDSSVRQVSPYLHDSFGHSIRLDYGTGHESSFLVFLLILSKVKCLGDRPDLSLATLRAVTLSIFHQYLKVTRRLQTDYRLEPAGSHGVWGLDDYHCLPFYFGACQLKGASLSMPQELLEPKCIADEHVLLEHGDVYMYFGCIRYIRQLKTGVPFFESSPMLYDISQTITSWEKVASGLLRLYQGEVLHKRVVVQHFVFSKLFPCTWTPSRSEREAPTETFRKSALEQSSSVPSGQGIPMPPTRAPWAKLDPNENVADLMTTRAPWAK
jgi:hypothetical protein